MVRAVVLYDEAPDPARYDGTIVEGVRRFQVRHGLEPDGVLGKSTMSALRIPLAWRVRQLVVGRSD